MVERATSLADLLADETGNLRPEAIDLLINIQPQGGQQPGFQPPRGQAPRRRRLWRWFFTSLILGVSIILIKTFISNHIGPNRSIEVLTAPFVASQAEDQNELTIPFQQGPEGAAQDSDRTVSVSRRMLQNFTNTIEGLKQRLPLAGKGQPNSVSQAVFLSVNDPEAKDIANDKGSTFLNPPQLTTSMILGKAKTIGYHVNIRQAPRLNSNIIRQTSQGEIFLVGSFSRGWYEIMFEDSRPGYIFGAYLRPLDFQLPAHWLGVARDCTKLLLMTSQCPACWQVILPDGTRRSIHKNDVRIIK